MQEIRKETASAAWELISGQVRLELSLQNGKLLLSMRGKAPGMDFDAGDLGQLAAGGVPQEWSRVICAEEEQDPAGRKTLTIMAENKEGTLRLTRSLTVFPDQPFCRIWGTVENTGSETVQLDDCALFSIRPCGGLPMALFHVEQFSAKYQHDFFRPNETRLITGRTPHEIRMGSFPSMYWAPTSCAWFALLEDTAVGWFDQSPAAGPGMVCGIEFNGKSRLSAWADTERAQIVSRIDSLAHPLAPGEVFEIPAAFFGRFDGDWDEAGFVTQRFAEAEVHPPVPDGHYPWAQYNSWAYGQEINEEQQLQAIDRAAELGLELAVLDLGWARTVGDWRPDPVKFPHGLKPLVERAKSYGMRFGVHVALAQCNLAAPAAKEHPDWIIQDKIDYFGAAPLCLGHKPCRDWLIESLSSLIESEGIDYIVQDGEDMVKYCRRADHTHGAGDSNYANSQNGLDVVIRTLRQRYPQVVLENCEDGGCMMTYQMARLYHTSITVDNIDTYSTRQGIYGASYPFSPRYSVRYMQDAPTRYTLYSSIFGGPLILMHRLTEWTPEQMAETKEAIALYKQLRELVRGSKIVHLEAPRNNVPGGGWGWDAIQAVVPDQSRSVAMVYRAAGGETEHRVYPRGLKADARYSLRLSEQPAPVEVRTGRELETQGVCVHLEEFGAEILWLELAD